MTFGSLTLPSIDILLIAGRAVFLLVSFIVAAIAFTRWRKAAARDTERTNASMSALFDRLSDIEAGMACLDSRLAEISNRLDERAHVAPATAPSGSSPSYPIAIRLARNGATCEELMESCGLGRQEAELVQRLHAPKKQRRQTVAA